MSFFKNVFLMLLVNIGVIITISIVLSLIGFSGYQTEYGVINYQALAVFSLVIGMTSSFISLFLSKFMVKMTMRVKTVDPNTQDPTLKKLHNMLRLSSQKAGIRKIPEFGVYDSPEMNAFATGYSKNSSLVAVSTGLIQNMDDDEIHGVIAHEVAHIANGDMVTMTLIQGVVNALVVFLSRIVASVVASRIEGRSRHMVHLAIVIVGQIVFGLLGVMITSWFSRYREFRADAGGAKYSSNKQMVLALQALQNKHNTFDPRAPQLQAFKISGQRKGGFARLMSTHPPLEDRIAALKKGQLF